MAKVTITSTAIDAGFIAKRGPNAFAVLTVILRHKNENNQSWPGIHTIMKKTGLGEKSVRAAIKVLKTEKDIERSNPKKGKRGSRVITKVLTNAMGCYKKVLAEKCQVDTKVLAGFRQLLSKYLPKSTWQKVVGTFRQPHHEVIESIEVIIKEVVTTTTKRFEEEVEKLRLENGRLSATNKSLQQKIETLQAEAQEQVAQAKADEIKSGLRQNVESNMEAWTNTLLGDQQFLETLAMKYRLKNGSVSNALHGFIAQKQALGEDTWKDYQAFKKNFYYWIPKSQNADNARPKHRSDVSRTPQVWNTETARKVYFELLAEDREADHKGMLGVFR